MVRKEPEEKLKMKEKEVTMRVQSAQGLGEMESSALVRDCLRQEEGHLPVEGEEGRRLLMGWRPCKEIWGVMMSESR